MKRIVSILLAAMMVIALIPAVSAAGATLEYVFTNTAQEGTGTVTPRVEAFYGWSKTGSEWQFVNMANYNSCALYTDYSNWAISTESKPEYNGDDKMSGAYAIEIKIPEGGEGTYTPTIEYRGVAAGATAEVYLVEKEKFGSGDYYFVPDYTEGVSKAGYDNEDNTARREVFCSAVKAMSANDRLGEINTYSASNLPNQLKTFRDIEIEKSGSYILVIVPTGAEVQNTNGVYNVQLHSFTLNKITENTAVEQEYVITTEGKTNDWEVASAHGYNVTPELRNVGYYQGFRAAWFKNNEEYRNYHIMFRVNVKEPGTYDLQIKGAPVDTANEIFGMGVHWLKDDGNEVEAASTASTDSTSHSAFDLVGGNSRSSNSSFVGTCDFDDAKPDYQNVATITADESGDYLVAVFGNTYTTATNTETTSYPKIYLSGIKLVPAADDHVNVETAEEKAAREAIQNEGGDPTAASSETETVTTSTVTTLAAYIGGTNGTLENAATKNDDGTYAVAAPATTSDGYSFLYWTKGLSDYSDKRILSVSNEFTYKPEIGANYLIAVYGKEDDTTLQTAKYYNANGQLLEDATGETIPSMPGYGSFKAWGDCGNNIYMAEYETETTYTVTVNHEGEPVETKTPAYGGAVTVTAPARASDGYNVFNYWEKDGEIVSFDREYTFYAFEDCTVNAVYNEYEPIEKTLGKIILTKIGESSSYMAEFIGFDDAVEKGIAVGDNKIAMTSAKTQFTINAEDATVVKGYVIDKDGKVYYGE